MERAPELARFADLPGHLAGPCGAARRLALTLFDAALAAVDPEHCTARAIAELAPRAPVTVIAFGKAAVGMARAALGACAVREGIVIAPEPAELAPFTVLRGRHPVPSDDAPAHARAVLDLAARVPPQSEVLVLVSGGGSSLLELPRPGVDLAALQALTHDLQAAGADIAELNAVRSALSQVKGGRLAQALGHARVRNIVLSDVVGSPLATIASGPTVAPEPSAPRPLDVLARHGLLTRVPESVRAALAEPAAPGRYHHVTSVLAADNLTAQRAMLARATALGVPAALDPVALVGEARSAGPAFVARAAARGCTVIGGGETTVTVRGPGRGGRNQELALACLAPPLPGTFAAFASDGVDGASTAAGAFADACARERGAALGLDPGAHLARNDSATFHARSGSAIVCGATGTNVADVCVYVPPSLMLPP